MCPQSPSKPLFWFKVRSVCNCNEYYYCYICLRSVHSPVRQPVQAACLLIGTDTPSITSLFKLPKSFFFLLVIEPVEGGVGGDEFVPCVAMKHAIRITKRGQGFVKERFFSFA